MKIIKKPTPTPSPIEIKPLKMNKGIDSKGNKYTFIPNVIQIMDKINELVKAVNNLSNK